MEYRILDPRPMSFAEALVPEDPWRHDLARPLGYRYGAPYIDDPHRTTSWLLVALPSASLERWYHHEPNGRLTCDAISWRAEDQDRAEAMSRTLLAGGSLWPVMALDIGFDYAWMIDGFHRAGASLIAGSPEIRAHLLIGQRPAGAT